MEDVDLAQKLPNEALLPNRVPFDSHSMSKPSTWLLTFRDGLESTFSASVRKLESLFADNATWIEDQRRKVRVAKEENERQLKVQQDALAAVNASVKKPRGRPKKAKTTIEKAIIVPLLSFCYMLISIRISHLKPRLSVKPVC